MYFKMDENNIMKIVTMPLFLFFFGPMAMFIIQKMLGAQVSATVI